MHDPRRRARSLPRSVVPFRASAAAALACGLSLGCGVSADDFASEQTTLAEREILNGVSTWSAAHERYVMQPTVRVRAPSGGICSGVALRNNWILTARHCTTTDATVGGAEAPASAISVASSPETPTADCNSETCRTAHLVISGGGTTQDVALVMLSDNIRVNGVATGWGMKIEPFDPVIHEGGQLLVSGYGRNTLEGGGSGTLRQGTVAVRSTNGTWAAGRVNTGRVLETIAALPLSEGGQLSWLGDSGGPYWNQLAPDPATATHTQVPMLLAVHNHRQSSDDDAVAYATLSSAFRTWVYNAIFQHTTTVSDPLTSGEFLSSVEQREPIRGSSGPPNWSVSTAGLHEPSNFNTPYPAAIGTMQIHRAAVYENFDMRVTVSGTDNDSVGLVFFYVDEQNYLRFSVDEERRFARIIRMTPAGPVTLAENTTFAVDYHPGVTLRVTTSGRDIRAYVNSTQVLFARDRHVMIGRVGLYENGMSNVAFRDWRCVPKVATLATVPF